MRTIVLAAGMRLSSIPRSARDDSAEQALSARHLPGAAAGAPEVDKVSGR
ncbi:MAG TPA: hypothetical protein VM094_02440 [Gemmatimonadales bacterium]|nr:hypothetical protein [Gemmatimonadales bacterium]